MESVLKLQDISVVRSGKTILNSISLEIKPAEQWIVLGPNGAGKTTLVSLLSTLMHPTSGQL
ncbi:MAG: hypothetical protein RL038_1218, partial [Actinomycetota bacterium]